MDNTSIWIQRGHKFTQSSSDFISKQVLPKGIYFLSYSDNAGFYLEYTSEKFVMDFKVYDMETEFIQHVIKTYQNTNRNFGVLLNGTKGTGKTVTAKILANTLDLPVIMITSNYPGLADYLGSIKDECILFFDEFEKIFEHTSGRELLSVMDGVYTANGRKFFLMTTNSKNIDDNFINRPSRIRYIKEFSDISEDTIRAYCADNLKYPEFLDNIISYCKGLSIITIDILKAIVEEINIHKVAISTIEDFNITHAYYQMGYIVFETNAPLNIEPSELTKYINTHEANAILDKLNYIIHAESGYSSIDKNDPDVIDKFKQEIMAASVGGCKVTKPHYRSYTVKCEVNPEEIKKGELIELRHTYEVYAVCDYNSSHKMLVLYDDEHGVFHYIRVQYSYPDNAYAYGRYE